MSHSNGRNGDGNRKKARERSVGHPRVSLIVPTLDEAKNLPHVLPAVPASVDEIVIVDGGSTDDTVAVAQQLRPTARIVHERRRGKGQALRTGFEASSGDILVMMDADGSMNPAEIPTYIAALLAGADVAKGSRFLQGGGTSDMSALRWYGNLALRLAVRATFGGRYSDLCYGYMAFWRHVLPTFDGGADGFEVETFLNVRALAAGLRIVEVASFESARLHGESHLRTFRDGSRALLTIARERRRLSEARGSRGVPRPAYAHAWDLAAEPGALRAVRQRARPHGVERPEPTRALLPSYVREAARDAVVAAHATPQ